MNFRTLLLLLSLSLTATLHAQSVVAKSILFTGAPQYQPAELLKLSGLTPGQRLTQPEIEAAMNKLDASGLFSGIEFKTSGDTLTFVLEPRAKAQNVRVTYGNFVWYTQDQLNAEVHSRIPFFTGTVPADGDLAADVGHALEAIVKQQHNVDVTVTSRPLMGGRLDYTITSPRVVVGDLRIANVDFSSDPLLKNVRTGISGSEFLDGVTNKQVQLNTADALEEIGYLDQKVGPVTLAEPVSDKLRIVVDMLGTAEPGPLFKVTTVTLPKPIGTVTPKDLDSDHAVKPGGRPSPSLVRNTTFGIESAYQRHGFLDARASVAQSRDDTTHTIAFTYSIVPGEVYHFRSLVFGGTMTAQQQSVLTQNWKLSKGAVYEAAVADASINAKSVALVCGGPLVLQALVPDKATHEVDVNLSCSTHPHP